MKPNNQNYATKVILYVVLIILGIGAYTYLDYINIMLLYDDAYTMQMVKHSFADIYSITAGDVHPPLYYWALKLYSLVFGSTIFAERSFSTIGMLAIMLFGAFPLRRRLGDKTALLFIGLMVFFPVTQFLATEIRMYSWAVFFVLAAATFAYDAYMHNRWIDWVKLLAMAIGAAYTHYFALMSACWIFVVLLAAIIATKKVKVKYYITLLIFALSYTPWIANVYDQIRGIKRMFFVNPFSIDDISYHLYYFYSIKKEWLPVDDTLRTALMYGVAVILLVQLVVLVGGLWLHRQKKDKDITTAFLALLVFMLPVVCAFVVSVTYKPIMAPRYIACGFGLLVLSMAIILGKCLLQKCLRIFAVAFVALVAIYGGIRYCASVTFYKEERWAYHSMHKFLEKYDKDSKHTFLSEFYATSALSRLNIFYPDDNYYVLTPVQWKVSFAPFHFNRVQHKQKFDTEFILVQQVHSEGGDLAVRFRNSLEENYAATDSITALNMILYKMKAREIQVAKDSLEQKEME